MALRIGILGGTFDPVHNAHLAIANAALDALALQQVLWLPTGAPAYREAPAAAAAHRLAMVKLAIAGEARHAVDEYELQPQASGFTYDSIKALQGKIPAAEFILLMGGDQYARRESWHRWKDLMKLCRIAVFERPGSPPSQDGVIHVPMTPLPVSASDIRARISRGDDVAQMLPPQVLGYIRDQGLYR